MTHFEMTSALNPEKISDKVFQVEQARNCLLPMGTTSDVGPSPPTLQAPHGRRFAECVFANK